MEQRYDNGRHGFVLHNSCWCLLQKAFEPTLIPLQRLLELCESLSFPLRTSSVYWGHDFGGLWAVESRNAFPWQEEFFQRRQPSAVYLDGLENPLNVPCIPEMLSARIQLPFAGPLIRRSRDCFSLLPWEILDKIGILLATKDALNLRRVSASFLPLYISECFWASRFSADGERGFLFEAREPRGYLDWLTLHRLSRLSRCPSGLRNRRRVWGLTKIIVNIAQQRRADIPPGTESEVWAQHTWTQVSCDIHSEAEDGCWSRFHRGCRSFGTCIITPPNDLMQVGITTIEMGVCTYITGLRFMSRTKLSTRVGYVAEQEESTFTISDLHGFRVAMSQSGIRALQLVGKNGHCSQWAGDPTAMPVSNRLVKSKPIRRLAVSYDVSDLHTRSSSC